MWNPHIKRQETALLLTGSLWIMSFYSLAGPDLDLNPSRLATEKENEKKWLRFEIRTSAGTGIKQV
jgi:hypothetical protein